MTEQLPPLPRTSSANEIMLVDLAHLLLRRWAFLFLGGIFAMAIGTIALFLIQPNYTVTMKIMPIHSGNSGGSKLAGLGMDGDLSGLMGGSPRDLTFKRYRAELFTVTLAQRLIERHGLLPEVFPNLWDAQTKTFRARRGLGGRLLYPLYRALGIITEAHPTPLMLAEYLAKNVLAAYSKEDDILEMTMSTPDPKLAIKLMLAMHTEANDILREQSAHQAERTISYLHERLGSAMIQDARISLVSMLSEQEKLLLLSQPGLPYAAEMLDPPTPSDVHTSPKPILVLPISFVVGFMLSIGLQVIIDALKSPRPGQRN